MTDQVIINLPDTTLLSDAPIWNLTIRNNVTENKLSTDNICKLQSKQLVPGTINQLAYDFNVNHYVPLILINNNSYYNMLASDESGRSSKGNI